MKISYLPLLRTLVLCLFASFSAYSQLVPSQADNAILRYIDPSNPIEANNVDPNWDWTQCCSGNTMYYSLNGSAPIQLNNVQVPFYTNGHQLVEALNNDSKDMWQQDGWMLAYKDFGTSASAPPYPFFVLYNKYKGVFRAMIYNASSMLNTYFKVSLGFRGGSPKSALFTYTEKRGGYQALNSYDGNTQQTVITQAAQGQGWIYADFVIAGYVPDLSSSTMLRMSIQAVNESQLNVTGDLTIDEVVKSSPGGNDINGDVKYTINNGYKVYKDMSGVIKDSGKTTSGFSSVLGFLSAFTDLVGIFDYFISGKNHMSGREPLSFKGTTSLTGTLTTAAPMVQYDFALSTSAPNSPDYYRPIQNIPWGVLNIVNSVSTYSVDNTLNPYFCWDRNENVSDIHTYHFGNPVSYVINPNIGMTLVSAEVQPIRYDNINFSSLSNISNVAFGSFYYDACYGQSSGFTPFAMGIKFEFQINSPTKNYDNRLIFYKIYYLGSNSGRVAANSEHPTAMKAYPNPFSQQLSVSFPATQTGTISIFDGKGILVKTYSGSELSSGIIQWDGKSANGNNSPAGVYFFQINDFPKKPITKRVIKLN